MDLALTSFCKVTREIREIRARDSRAMNIDRDSGAMNIDRDSGAIFRPDLN